MIVNARVVCDNPPCAVFEAYPLPVNDNGDYAGQWPWRAVDIHPRPDGGRATLWFHTWACFSDWVANV